MAQRSWLWGLVRLAALVAVCTAAAACEDLGWREYSDAGLQAFARGDYAAAEELLSAAVEDAEQYGPEDRRLARTLTNLAGLYSMLGRTADAEPLYQRALAITESSLGPDHQRVAVILDNYAILLRRMRRDTEAEQMLERARQIRSGQ